MKKSTANSTAGFSRLENRSNLDTKGHRLKPAVLLRRILSRPLSHIVEVPGARDMGQRHANLIVLPNFRYLDPVGNGYGTFGNKSRERIDHFRAGFWVAEFHFSQRV